MTTGVRPTSHPATPTGTQLATAFDGKLEGIGVSPLYQISVVLVAGLMILLPLVYLAIIAAAVGLLALLFGSAGDLFSSVARHGRAVFFVGVLFIAGVVANVLLILGLVLPIFWRSKEPRAKTLWISPREQPLLFAYVHRLCDVMRVPRPVRIDVIAGVNASAHIDNGVFGLIHRRLVLTIGLPLAAGLDLRQFTGVLAHEFGHFSQGISMRLSYAVVSLNQWFARIAYTRSGIDEMLEGMAESETHWSVSLIALTAQLMMWLARTVLKSLALLSHALTMGLSRHAEFDADRKAARIVGSEPLAVALQALPTMGAAESMAVRYAQQAWQSRQLADDLVAMIAHFSRHLPADTKRLVENQVLLAETSWFDTHPPLFKRVAALKKRPLAGVLKLDAPATCLFRDFEELSKISTIDFYQMHVGDALQPEHLVTVKLKEPTRVTPAPGRH